MVWVLAKTEKDQTTAAHCIQNEDNCSSSKIREDYVCNTMEKILSASFYAIPLIVAGHTSVDNTLTVHIKVCAVSNCVSCCGVFFKCSSLGSLSITKLYLYIFLFCILYEIMCSMQVS